MSNIDLYYFYSNSSEFNTTILNRIVGLLVAVIADPGGGMFISVVHYGSLALQQTATIRQAQAQAPLRRRSVSSKMTVYRHKTAAKEATREETKQRRLI